MEQTKQFMELIDSIVVNENRVTLRLNNQTFIVINRNLDNYNGTKECYTYTFNENGVTNYTLREVGKCEIYME